jgi:hypothetical protein
MHLCIAASGICDVDAAIAYPPHDTPVRLIALLEKKGSPADDAFREACEREAGFPKATYYGTENCA